jgi:hypothetical protein
MTTTDLTPPRQQSTPSLHDRFGAFIAERFPFALRNVLLSFEQTVARGEDADSPEALRRLGEELVRSLRPALLDPLFTELPPTTPRVTAEAR